MAKLSESDLEELRRLISEDGRPERDVWKLLFSREARAKATQTRGEALLHGAYCNDMITVEQVLGDRARAINFVDPTTGMNALHIAVGRNHLDMARYLVEKGIAFVPDNQGRMPTTIAAECEVSDEMCDFIAEAEAKAEGV